MFECGSFKDPNVFNRSTKIINLSEEDLKNAVVWNCSTKKICLSEENSSRIESYGIVVHREYLSEGISQESNHIESWYKDNIIE